MKRFLGLLLVLLSISFCVVQGEVALRGPITDRNGEVLAYSVPAFDLQLIPDDTIGPSDAKSILEEVRLLLEGEPKLSEKVLAQLLAQRDRRPIFIQAIDADRAASIRKRGIKRWEVAEWNRRIYPHGKFAAHAFGFMGRDRGNAGLEGAFDADLQRNRGLVTTLDFRIQQCAEKALSAQDRPGGIVVLDPTTGDLLALASFPAFDPNRFVPAIPADEWQRLMNDIHTSLESRAFAAVFEPGATIHAFSGLCAISAGKLEVHERVHCPKLYKAGKTTFQRLDSGDLDFSEALRHSNDIFFAQVATRIPPAQFYDLLGQFGFGRQAGLPVKMEKADVVKANARDESMEALASAAIGLGSVKINGVRLASAMTAIANRGTIVEPRLAVRLTNADAKEEFPIKKAEIPVPKPALDAVTRSMEAGMRGKLQFTAARPPVAGVIGTSQFSRKIDNDSVVLHRGIFAGFAPADQPRFVVVIVLEECAGGAHTLPVAAQLFDELLK